MEGRLERRRPLIAGGPAVSLRAFDPSGEPPGSGKGHISIRPPEVEDRHMPPVSRRFARPEPPQSIFPDRTAIERDEAAMQRDVRAMARDQAATARDRKAAEGGLARARRWRGGGRPNQSAAGARGALRAQAASDRLRAAAGRARAASDRKRAAEDRRQARTGRIP